MNIFCNAGGTIFHVDTEVINQGSLGVNKIRLIGQFPSYSQVLMAFTLPDGTVTKPRYLAKAVELDEIKVENGTSFTVWEGLIGATPRIEITGEGDTLKAEPVKDSNGKIVYDLDYTLTEYYGDVDVQFFVYSSGVPIDVDGTIINHGYGCLATEKARFTIQKGVPMEVYESDLNYDEPKALLSQILAVVSNEGLRIYNLEFEVANLPAVVTEVIRFDTDLANLKFDLGASIPLPKTAFSKQPKLWDKITANCISKDNKAFLLDGVVTVSTSENFSVKILSLKNLGDADDIEARLSEAKEQINSNASKLMQLGINKLNRDNDSARMLEVSEKLKVYGAIEIAGYNGSDGYLKYEALDGATTYIKEDGLKVARPGGSYSTRYGSENIDVLKNLSHYIYGFPEKSGTIALQEDVELVEQIAKGAQQAISFDSYQQMVNVVLSWEYGKYNVGQSIYIGDLNVPDLWIFTKDESYDNYNYNGNLAIVNALKNWGYIKIGYYYIGQLETGKVNMDYTKVTSNGETLSNFDLDSYTQNINKELNDKLSKQGGQIDGPLDVQGDVIAQRFKTGDYEFTDDGIWNGDYNMQLPEKDGTFVVLEDDGTVHLEDSYVVATRFIAGYEDAGIHYGDDGIYAYEMHGPGQSYEYYFPPKSGTFLVDDDLRPVKGRLDIIELLSKVLMQSGLLKKYKQPIEQEYSERVTANGLNVLDGSKAILKKVVGSTVSYGADENGMNGTLKSASFGGIESTNADGTGTSTLDFPKTETPLGVTIDFESKKITNTHADYTFTGDEGWAKGGSAPSGFERWYCSIPNMASGLSSNDFNYGVCDKYPTIFNINEYYATKEEGVIFGFGAGNNYFQFIVSEGQTEQSVRELTKGMTVRFPLDNTYHTSTDFTAQQSASGNEYTAYKGGTERVLGNDGKDYGADNTLTQDYILVMEVK